MQVTASFGFCNFIIHLCFCHLIFVNGTPLPTARFLANINKTPTSKSLPSGMEIQLPSTLSLLTSLGAIPRASAAIDEREVDTIAVYVPAPFNYDNFNSEVELGEISETQPVFIKPDALRHSIGLHTAQKRDFVRLGKRGFVRLG
ncbi:unnamed protein product [Protopolystoma xenopodis]|uniref:Uncharacterized protein n=1 Tax=Protopolystoma xenopodis TaxID=117903 RepID=A0A3S5A7V6_9PLAT|nr:unnamed protein product [Protopolystoma xenopodis]